MKHGLNAAEAALLREPREAQQFFDRRFAWDAAYKRLPWMLRIAYLFGWRP